MTDGFEPRVSSEGFAFFGNLIGFTALEICTYNSFGAGFSKSEDRLLPYATSSLTLV